MWNKENGVSKSSQGCIAYVLTKINIARVCVDQSLILSINIIQFIVGEPELSLDFDHGGDANERN